MINSIITNEINKFNQLNGAICGIKNYYLSNNFSLTS